MTRGRIRTCGAGQRIARLRGRGTVSGVRRLLGGRGQWLAVGAVERRGRAGTAPDGVGRHEGLGLGGDGGEDALLREADAVGAAAVLRSLETGAANLQAQCQLRGHKCRLSLSLSLSLSRHPPYAVCSSGRQWRCAAAGRADAAGTCAAVVCRDPAAEGRDTSGAAPAGGRAAVVGGKSCRDADLLWAEGACVTVRAKVRHLV